MIIHVEPEFDDESKTLEDLANRIVAYSKYYNHVINVTMELSCGFPTFHNNSFEIQDWLWGFDEEEYLQYEPNKWILGYNYLKTSGHPYSEITEWMRNLDKGAEYTLVGGSRLSCLADVYDILKHLECKVDVAEHLVYF